MNNLMRKFYAIVMLWLLGTAPIQAQDPPNIILIMADYMGYNDVEPYGGKEINTPVLSSLADSGVRYTNCYASAPVCGPSRASILTGKYPIKNGFEGNIGKHSQGLSSKHPIIPKRLKEVGYTSALIGKWHLGFKEESSPVALGFDTFFGFKNWSIDYYTHKDIAGDTGLYFNDSPVVVEGYATTVFTDSAIAFVDRNKVQPFFLSLFYNATLPPLQRPNNPTDIRSDSSWFDSDRADYISVLENMDQNIGRLVDKLRKENLLDNTIIIFTYDHGGKDYVEHGDLSHGFATLYEGGIKVPLIVSYPKFGGKAHVDHSIVTQMDLTYSLLKLCGVTLSDDLDGVDIFSNQSIDNRSLFWKFGRNQFAVRKENWKYLKYKDQEYLFDLDKDSEEKNDLSQQEPSILDELKQEGQVWLLEHSH